MGQEPREGHNGSGRVDVRSAARDRDPKACAMVQFHRFSEKNKRPGSPGSAKAAIAGWLVDPFGGAADLRAGVLRHVGPAFVEDPVRVLRVGRFAARFGFAIAPETMELMRQMVHSGEVDQLVPERVWQEIARGLMERMPSRMIDVLDRCGALARIIPDCPNAGASAAREAVDHAAARTANLEERFAAWLGGIADATSVRRTADRLRASSEARELVILAARLPQPLDRWMQKPLPGMRPNGIAEQCPVSALFEPISPAVLLVGPADGNSSRRAMLSYTIAPSRTVGPITR